jgi:hypothetical protein
MNTDHLQQCADAGAKAAISHLKENLEDSEQMYLHEHIDGDARLAFARAAISTYLKLNPVWVRAGERMPTSDDADDNECVATMFRDKEESLFGYEDIGLLDSECLWTSIKHLPPPPDPFEDWMAKQPDDVRAADKELVKKIYNSIKA